jgi:hypothetical protein
MKEEIQRNYFKALLERLWKFHLFEAAISGPGNLQKSL